MNETKNEPDLELLPIQITQQWWSVSELAASLCVTPKTITNWIRAGLLRGARFGGVWRVSDQDWRAFLAAAHREADKLRAGREPGDFGQKIKTSADAADVEDKEVKI